MTQQIVFIDLKLRIKYCFLALNVGGSGGGGMKGNENFVYVFDIY